MLLRKFARESLWCSEQNAQLGLGGVHRFKYAQLWDSLGDHHIASTISDTKQFMHAASMCFCKQQCNNKWATTAQRIILSLSGTEKSQHIIVVVVFTKSV